MRKYGRSQFGANDLLTLDFALNELINSKRTQRVPIMLLFLEYHEFVSFDSANLTLLITICVYQEVSHYIRRGLDYQGSISL